MTRAALPPAITAYLGLGSNVGDREKNIADAITHLRASVSVLRVAPLYESEPVGVANQRRFINTAAEIQTSLQPQKLLALVKDVERCLGRIERYHWGPREIDIDILLYGDQIVDVPGLQIPHPRLHEREFALRPLADLASEFVHPITHKTIAALLAALLVGDPAAVCRL